MTEEVKVALQGAGMDWSAALERFMNNEGMLEKFLGKFGKDPSYASLLKAVEEKDLDTAFRSAHTLKGVAANFSFIALQQAASEQTEEFRAGRLEEGIALMGKVTEEYNRICAVLAQYYGE